MQNNSTLVLVLVSIGSIVYQLAFESACYFSFFQNGDYQIEFKHIDYS